MVYYEEVKEKLLYRKKMNYHCLLLISSILVLIFLDFQSKLVFFSIFQQIYRNQAAASAAANTNPQQSLALFQQQQLLAQQQLAGKSKSIYY